MTPQSVRPSEPATATPLSAAGEFSLTNELLLARVQPFMPFTIVLSSEGFATYSADKRPLVRVGSEM
jgi:hypothetical protein